MTKKIHDWNSHLSSTKIVAGLSTLGLLARASLVVKKIHPEGNDALACNVFQYNLHYLEPVEFDNIVTCHYLEMNTKADFDKPGAKAGVVRNLLTRVADTLLDNYESFLNSQIKIMNDPDYLASIADPLEEVARKNEIEAENRNFNRYVLELFYLQDMPLKIIEQLTGASPDELQETLFPLAVSNLIH